MTAGAIESSLKTSIKWPTKELNPLILNSLESLGFPTMTPVQSSTVPLFLNHKDVIVQAVTGSGKTLAFLVPILQILLRIRSDMKKGKIYALILLPTRELASQIESILGNMLEFINCNTPTTSSTTESQQDLIPITSQLFIGGTSVREDIERFSKHGSHILIGTPGRVQDLLSAHPSLFNVKEVEVLVMDEADRLLDLGFERQLMSIISFLPKQRRTCLFSATMNEGLSRIVKAGLRNPVKVSVKVQTAITTSSIVNDETTSAVGGVVLTEQSIPESLQVEYILCTPTEKLSNLLQLFSLYPNKKYIIYFANGACVDFYFKILPLLAPSMTFHSLHGKMVPKRRTATFSAFSTSPPSHVLLCTDVAARGLDLPDIDLVLQFDPPQDPKVFAHRCGRSGRAGRPGRAITFLYPNEETYISFLQIRKIPITECKDSLPLVPDLTTKLRDICASDRDVMEKSIKAFVSWVRSYTSHLATYIFNLKEVDMCQVCSSFGLLRIPKVPELQSLDLSGFVPSEVNADDVKYKDKTRERQRLASLDKPKIVHPKRVKGEAWSVQKKLKENRMERQVKKAKRRAAVAAKGEALVLKKDWKEERVQKKRK